MAEKMLASARTARLTSSPHHKCILCTCTVLAVFEEYALFCYTPSITPKKVQFIGSSCTCITAEVAKQNINNVRKCLAKSDFVDDVFLLSTLLRKQLTIPTSLQGNYKYFWTNLWLVFILSRTEVCIVFILRTLKCTS